MSPRIIVLTGRARSGKSTVSQYLRDTHGYTCVKFAQVLKDMLLTLGLTAEHIEGPLKEMPCGLLGGKTPRFAMQTLGTEWGRDIISPDLWVNSWRASVQRLLDGGRNVVTDDCRFDNELDAALSLGAVVVRVVRPDPLQQIQGTHPSEFVPEYFDAQVNNTGAVQDLHDQIEQLIKES